MQKDIINKTVVKILIALLLANCGVQCIDLKTAAELPVPCELNYDQTWIVVAIIFIVLFVISFAINMFLWIVRRRNIKLLQEEMHKQYKLQMTDNQTNVFYGGTKSTYI